MSQQPGENLDPRPMGEVEPISPERHLMFIKHGHRYVFRFSPGDESKVLDGLLDLARDPDCDLDWFDAAVLTHQMGQRLSEQLQQLLKS